ncbi:MAG: hypothetical protein KF809_18615 [Chloroflexi bacterium]|nr:hypothetical protein [Chloroflexota bacterium]
MHAHEDAHLHQAVPRADDGRFGRTSLGILTVGLAGLVSVAALAGILLRGTGGWIEVTSVRGETYQMATDGVYAWNAQRMVAEGIGWDVFTLLVIAPGLLLMLPGIRRGSPRLRLAHLGLVGYVLYQYLEYAVTWAFGPLFPLYLVIGAAATVALILGATSLTVERVSGQAAWHLDDRYPTRSWAILATGMAALLSLLWLGRVMGALRDGVQGVLLGETTLTVQALDVILVVPLLLVAGVGAWRGGQSARAFGAAMVVAFAMMAGAITSMLLGAWVVEGVLELPPVILFGGAAVAATVIGLRMYRSLEVDDRTTRISV